MLKYRRFNETVVLLLGLFVFVVMFTIWLSGIGAAMVLVGCAFAAPIITKNFIDPIRILWRRYIA